MTVGPTRLTDLQVHEVSLVTKGAIGEVFSIMKSDEESVIKDAGQSVLSMVESMPDPEFVSCMKQMLDRYQQINKNLGGSKMERDEIVSLVTEVIAKSMETVNSNFSKINKSIDEITQQVEKASKLSEEEQAAMEKKKAEMMNAENSDVKKAIGTIGDAVKGLAESVSAISKGLEGLGTIGETVKKMAEETLPEISTRVEAIEKQEQKPNGLDGQGKETQVAKSGSKWPSFVSRVE